MSGKNERNFFLLKNQHCWELIGIFRLYHLKSRSVKDSPLFIWCKKDDSTFIINQKFTIYKIENVDFDHAIMSNCIKNIFNNVENFYFSPMKNSAEAGNSHTSKECHVNSAHISTHVFSTLLLYFICRIYYDRFVERNI